MVFFWMDDLVVSRRAGLAWPVELVLAYCQARLGQC